AAEQRAQGLRPARSFVERSSGDAATQLWGISPAAAGASFWRRRHPRRGGQAMRACMRMAAAAAASFHEPPRRAAASRPWRARTAVAVRTPKAGIILLWRPLSRPRERDAITSIITQLRAMALRLTPPLPPPPPEPD
uniref:Uncharacterized protein n=1 Tax=Triticum urartu TaxID=4572 RepID=A0A8R7V2K2_TRIUA